MGQKLLRMVALVGVLLPLTLCTGEEAGEGSGRVILSLIHITFPFSPQYQNIYGCDTCARRNQYQGYVILGFAPGSIEASTVLRFRTADPPQELAQEAERILTNATKNQTGLLELNKVQGSPVTSTPESSTTVVSITNSTTQTPLRFFYLAYHIQNRAFDNTLLDPTSAYYMQIHDTIGKMYQNLYGCDECKHKYQYQRFEILQFGPGSVATSTLLHFKTEESPEELAQEAEIIFRNADSKQQEQLQLTAIRASSTPLTLTEPAATEAPIRSWDIALLVLVSVLLLLIIIAFLLLIIYRCRKSHRGHLNLSETQGSYRPTSEYPRYQTHGRYNAPFNKTSPYDDKLPTNGNRLFSYTPRSMADNP
ncbi:mucin-1-like [Paroedura picta]|uniref:mucin-1-like n=1 Tax=Paroedura picta TaxID=143630 RepID=UPI004056C777